jgi:hypothetical protein
MGRGHSNWQQEAADQRHAAIKVHRLERGLALTVVHREHASNAVSHAGTPERRLSDN